MKRILLPTDFSENSLNAINYAMDFFKGKECEFFFLNVQKPSEFLTSDIYTSSPLDSTIYTSVAEDNKQQLNDLVETYSKKYSDESYSFEGIFDFDVFVDAVQQTVFSKNIELIIMGTNGATNAAEVVFGSNTLKVIRNLNCPILTIPEMFKYQSISSVMLTIKDEDEIHPSALQPIELLFKNRNVALEVLHLDTQKELPNSTIFEVFTEITNHHINGVPTPEAVSSFEQLLPVGMHIIFIHPKSFFERIFSGTDTPQLSYESRIPLLVLK